MKIKCFLIAVCGICLFATAKATKPDSINPNTLEGVWVLDSVNIKQITKSGDAITPQYVPENHNNLEDCIFLEVTIQDSKCVLKSSNTDIVLNYRIKDSETFVIFMPPIEFEFKYILNKNLLSIFREYQKYNSETNSMDTFKVRLDYNKNNINNLQNENTL
jgi:hypothetical protein